MVGSTVRSVGTIPGPPRQGTSVPWTPEGAAPCACSSVGAARACPPTRPLRPRRLSWCSLRYAPRPSCAVSVRRAPGALVAGTERVKGNGSHAGRCRDATGMKGSADG
jgi:hypothetical protein